MSAGNADVEAYVGRALRFMAAELHPEVLQLLRDDSRSASSDPYDILRWMPVPREHRRR